MRAAFRSAGVCAAVSLVLRAAVLAPSLALWVLGCSGGTLQDAPQAPGQPAVQQPAGNDTAAAHQAGHDAAARLEARQETACQGVGEALFACAAADARATMSPEELAELDIERLKPAYMQEFLAECQARAMSSRQIGVYEGCLADTRCEVFVPCLDRARPQPAGATPAREP